MDDKISVEEAIANARPIDISDMGAETIYDRVCGFIQEHGHAVMGVAPDPDAEVQLPFSYTVGLCRDDLPELIVIGPHPSSATVLLNEAVGRIRDDTSLLLDKTLDFGGQFPVQLVEADIPELYTTYTTLSRLYAEREGHLDNLRVIQLALCDPHGRWPWDPECSEPFCTAPTLTTSELRSS